MVKPKKTCDHCGRESLDGCVDWMIDGSACSNYYDRLKELEHIRRCGFFSDLFPTPKRYVNATLTPRPGDRERTRCRAYGQIRKYIESVKSGETKSNLLIIGPNGCGKTWMAHAAVNYAKELLMTTIITEITTLLMKVRSTYGSEEAEFSEDSLFEAFCMADIVCFDDIGKQNDTGWSSEFIWQAIDSRYREEKPTIITSDSSADEIFRTRHATPIISRLTEDLTTIKITGESLRLPERG